MEPLWAGGVKNYPPKIFDPNSIPISFGWRQGQLKDDKIWEPGKTCEIWYPRELQNVTGISVLEIWWTVEMKREHTILSNQTIFGKT